LSRVGDLKVSVLDGLLAIPALVGVDVRLSKSARAPFRMVSRRRGVFLTYFTWMPVTNDRQYAGSAQSKKWAGYDVWSVVIMDESYRSAEDAFKQEGGADELLDAVLSLRGTNLAPSGWTHGPYFLSPTGPAELTESDDNPLSIEGGGTMGYVVTFTSEPYSL
jgi:hypothetical protein